jgi:hypothetical protein
MPRGPFYSSKAARSRWRPTWKANLAFYRVVHRTVRCTTGQLLFMSGARFLSIRRTADRWSKGSVGAPDSPVCPTDRWRDHVSRKDCAADRCAGDRWLTGQSGAPPDSPVNFSHVALMLFPRAKSSPRMTHWTVRCTTRRSGDFLSYATVESRERRVHADQSGAPDTVRCTTEQSGVPGRTGILLHTVKSFAIRFSSS